MHALWTDVRYGLRQMARAPGLTLTIILTLAVGIGATAGIFTAVNAVLLRALPYEQADQLVAVRLSSTTRDFETSASADVARALATPDGPLQRFALIAFDMPHLTGGGEPEQVYSAPVSGNFFSLFGTPAEVGRTFTASDRESDAVAVLGHGLWLRRFGQDPAVVGRTIHLDDKPFIVVGIMPASFQYPRGVQLWTAGVPGADEHAAGPAPYEIVGRLKPHVTLTAAQAAADVVRARFAAAPPHPLADYRIHLVGLKDTLVQFYDRMLLLLFGAVGFVLLIACVNVANLLLSRAAGRQREMSVRASLGATRLRLIRQLLTEGLLLTAAAAALGLSIAQWTVEAFIALAPDRFPRLDEIAIDPRVLGFTAGLAALTGLLCSLGPAWYLSRADLRHGLSQSTPIATAPRRRWRAGRVLLAVQMALSTALLVGTGLAVNSLLRLTEVNPGFQTTHVLTARLSPFRHYRTDDVRLHFYQEVLQQVRQTAGVDAAAAANVAPLGRQISFPVQMVAATDSGPRPSRGRFSVVSPAYFSTLGIPLIVGRTFTAADDEVVIVNRTLAERFWPGHRALGRRLGVTTSLSARPPAPRATIVGIVSDSREVLQRTPQPHVYTPLKASPTSAVYLIIRTRIDPRAMIARIKTAVWSVDPDQPLSEIHTMSELRSQEMSLQRLLAGLLSSFGLIAALLSALGLVALVAYWVSERTHEFGVRAALGASPGALTRLGVKQMLWPILAGTVLGLAGALDLSRLMAHNLFEVSPTDRVTYALVITLQIAVACAAAWWPARRAGRIDPVAALREE